MSSPHPRCFLLLLTVVAVWTFGSTSLAQGNLLTNPGFEDAGGSFNGWNEVWGNALPSTPATGNIFRTGSAAGKAYGPFYQPGGTSGFGQGHGCTAGMVYELSGYSYVSSADPLYSTDPCRRNHMVAKIEFSPGVGDTAVYSNEIVIADADTPTDQWHHFSVSAQAPPGAVLVKALFVFVQPDENDTGAAVVDDLSLREFTAPPPEPNLLLNESFDTDLSGWTTFGNVFHEARPFGIRTRPGSAKLFGSFASGWDSGMFQGFVAAPGSSWKLDVYAMHTCASSPGDYPDSITGDNFAVAKIVFRDAGYNEIGSGESVICNSSSPRGNWLQHSVVATAPTGTSTVEAFILFIQPDSQEKGSVFIDDARFGEWVGADLQLTKVVDNGAPKMGDTITYTVTLINAGPHTATGITVTDLLPAGLTFAGAGPNQGTYDPEQGDWIVGDLNLGESVTLGLDGTVDGTACDTVVNTAAITAFDQADPDADSNTASASITIDCGLSLGLEAYWNFDEGFAASNGNSAFDAIPNPSDGPQIDPAGKFGGAARFTRNYLIPANSDYLEVTAPVISQGRDHTYSAWYKLDVADIVSPFRYFVLESTPTYAISYGLRESGGDVGQVYTQWPGPYHNSSYVPGAAGTGWHNILVTYDCDTTGAEHTIYLDGNFVGTMASSDSLLTPTGLIIGGHRAGTERNWEGLIDDVAVWNRVLGLEEIAAIQAGPVQSTVSGIQTSPDPTVRRLHACYPNPFNPMTTIKFDLPVRERVSLRIFDISGRLVRTLVDGAQMEAGRREVVWRGRDAAGRRVAAGVYFFRLEAGSFIETRRMTLLK